jgi:hypothetical protein
MTAASPSTRTVFDRLASEQLVAPDWAETLAAAAAGAAPATPWFVRAMVGFGAWLAALLLIIFVVSLSVFTTGGGYLFIGLVLMAGACALRYRLGGDFARQLALATSLAGQGLFAFGVVESDTGFDIEAMLGTLIVINAVLLVAFPDKTHRFVSVLLVVGPFAGLLYAWEAQDYVALLGPVLAALLIVLLEREAFFAARGWLDRLTAIRGGVLISAFGSLMLSTIYVLPELIGDFLFYPRPWISSLLLGAMLIYVLRPAVAAVFGSASGTRAMAVYAATAVVVAAAWPAPGLILSLLVIVVASVRGNGVYRGAGIAFLALFTAAFFYGIDIGMLVKSASLVATGIVVLACRWLFLRAVMPAEERPDA